MCVESVLERLKGRQLTVTRNWQTFRTDVTERRDILVQLEENMVESTKVNIHQSSVGIFDLVLQIETRGAHQNCSL